MAGTRATRMFMSKVGFGQAERLRWQSCWVSGATTLPQHATWSWQPNIMYKLQVWGKRPVASFQSGNMLQRSVESRYWNWATAQPVEQKLASTCCPVHRVAASCCNAARHVIASHNASHRTLQLEVLANNVWKSCSSVSARWERNKPCPI